MRLEALALLIMILGFRGKCDTYRGILQLLILTNFIPMDYPNVSMLAQ